MTEIDAATCLKLLASQELRRLEDLPDAAGLYALADHFGKIHYFGMTASPKNFHDRIFQRHINGSEKNSHKLACNYNVGRMWRDKDHPSHIGSDAAHSKKLRMEFIRRHCRVACVELDLPEHEIKRLEKEVIALAPPAIKDWNGTRKRVSAFDEPRELVDALLGDLGWSDSQRQALDRQSRLYERIAAR
jgi:hypothetical protein